MLYWIISLFALGAILGLYLLTLILRDKETPKLISFIHGFFVLVALGFLIWYSTDHRPGLTECIILMVLAAMGGVVLIVRDLSGKKIPKWLSVSHGILAVAGFAWLLVYACNG
jgi:hypothetical protein